MQPDDTHKEPTTISIRQPEPRIRPITLSKNQPTQPALEVAGARIGADEAASSAIPRESQEQRGRDHSLNLLAHS